MDLMLLSTILTLVTIILVIVGIALLFYLTYKYEKLARENPTQKEMYRERRKTILRIYLRAVIIVFIVAVIMTVAETEQWF